MLVHFLFPKIKYFWCVKMLIFHIAMHRHCHILQSFLRYRNIWNYSISFINEQIQWNIEKKKRTKKWTKTKWFKMFSKVSQFQWIIFTNVVAAKKVFQTSNKKKSEPKPLLLLSRARRWLSQSRNIGSRNSFRWKMLTVSIHLHKSYLLYIT